MKRTKKLCILAVILSTPLFTQCVIEADPGDYGSEPNLSGNAQKSQQVYQKGRRMGERDGRNGLSRNPQRHAGQYPSSESDAFYSGYEKGYSMGIR